MRVFTLVGKTPYALGADELWTADLSQGKDFSEKEARDIVEEFKAIAREFKKEGTYWSY